MSMKTLTVIDFDQYLFTFKQFFKQPNFRMIEEEGVAEETQTPTHQIGIDMCQWCLNFIPEPLEYAQHKTMCSQVEPPGVLAYDDGKYRFYLIEPKSDYCRNLFNWSKVLFKRMENLEANLDLNYGMWNFIVLTIQEIVNRNNVEYFVGFFTKPTKRIVLGDLMIMPNYRKFGLEQLIIDFAYLLGSLDKKDLFVYPDMPIKLRNSFQEYWQWKIRNDIFFNFQWASVDIEAIRKDTNIATENIVNTLNGLDEIDRNDNGDVVIKFSAQAIPASPVPVASDRRLKVDCKEYELWNYFGSAD